MIQKIETKQPERKMTITQVGVLVEQLAEATSKGFAEVHARIDNVENELINTNSNVRSLESRFDKMDVRMEKFESRMGGMESKLEVLDLRAGRVESKLGTLDSKTETLESKLDDLHENMNEGFAKVHQEIFSMKVANNLV